MNAFINLTRHLWLVLLLALLSQPLFAYPNPVCSQCKERHRSKPCSKVPTTRSTVCDLCERRLEGRTYRFPTSGLGYCVECYEGSSKCSVCGQPTVLSKGGRKLSDGRVLCKIDDAKARVPEQRAHEILSLTEKELQLTFPGVFSLAPALRSLHLVPRDVLTREMGVSNHPSTSHIGGFARITQMTMGEKTTNKPAVIFILNGQPLEHILSSSAHEYAHVWQSQNNPRYIQCSQELKEGFSEWISYKVNQKTRRLGLAQAQRTSPRGVYTTGLEKFLKLEKKIGIDQVLKFATSATDI